MKSCARPWQSLVCEAGSKWSELSAEPRLVARELTFSYRRSFQKRSALSFASDSLSQFCIRLLVGGAGVEAIAAVGSEGAVPYLSNRLGPVVAGPAPLDPADTPEATVSSKLAGARVVLAHKSACALGGVSRFEHKMR